MQKYLVTDINIRKDEYRFYLLTNKEYIKFLKNDGDVDKACYLKYSHSKEVEEYRDFKALFDAIKENNVVIEDVYELDY